jgi:hypothetical protein
MLAGAEEDWNVLKIRNYSILGCVAIGLAVFGSSSTALAGGDPVVDQGYLDLFELTDGRDLDIGELGGGDSFGATKITVTAQPNNPSPPFPSDGRLTGTVHGKFRLSFLQDLTGDGFISSADMDKMFDVTWQLVGFDKTQGPNSAFYVADQAVGTEGTVRPYGPPNSVNFPPTPTGTAAIWNIAACDGTGFNPGTGTQFCNQFAIPGAVFFQPTFIDYAFPVSIPSQNDFTPGLTISDTNWVIAALLGRRAEASGPLAPDGLPDIAYGFDPLFSPSVAVLESVSDLVGPATLLNLAGEDANVDKADLLTSIQINVIPEPGTLTLLALAGPLMLLRRRR